MLQSQVWLFLSLFDAPEYPIADDDANGVGKKVCPEEYLTKQHVADEGVSECHQPRPTDHL